MGWQIVVTGRDVLGHPVNVTSVKAAFTPDEKAPQLTPPHFEMLRGWVVDADVTTPPDGIPADGGGFGRIQLTLTATGFAPVSVSLAPQTFPHPWQWNNGACTAVSGLSIVDLTATFIRISGAPPATVSDGELLNAARNRKTRAVTGVRPRGWLGELPPRGEPQPRRRTLTGLQHIHLPEPHLLGDPSGNAFDRFRTVPKDGDPGKSGRFLWVEWGDSDARAFAEHRRFLAAVWAPFPRLAGKDLPEETDFVLWFAPTTAKVPFSDADYPYGVLIDATNLPFQPYADLAYRHLFSQHHLAAQLLAAGRQAVLVMPIAAAGDLGPFASTSGWQRFLLELSTHLAATQIYPQDMPIKPPRPPRVGRIVVAAFSSGGTIATTLLTHGTKLPDKLPDPAWGAGPGADTDFHTRFAEFWDLDTSLTDLPKGAFERRRGTEAAWLADGGGRRRLRFYHSVTTIGGWLPDSSTEADPGFRKLLETGGRVASRAVTPSGDWAEQWEDGSRNWAIVLFSDNNSATTATTGYLGGPGGIDPPSGAGHEVIPQLAFGHAASLSTLATPSPPSH
ncbi:hypothetical protein [Streptomyces anandii]|uniref:hypothetical protein n=1 Tax=Streptomyces anandii TaxID=285454 RepID=UPI00167935EA|nr:hypothetical protein [Streptomyces anandii]GGY15892.1 hypothetical protein GCM10010510_71850 [Streptomyces anandii JCM 4720]